MRMRARMYERVRVIIDIMIMSPNVNKQYVILFIADYIIQMSIRANVHRYLQ